MADTRIPGQIPPTDPLAYRRRMIWRSWCWMDLKGFCFLLLFFAGIVGWAIGHFAAKYR